MCILHAKVVRVKGRDRCNLVSQLSENKWENTLQNDFPVLPTERHETGEGDVGGSRGTELRGHRDWGLHQATYRSLGHLPSAKRERLHFTRIPSNGQ